MKERVISNLLVLFLVMSMFVPCFAEAATKISNAVYLGVVDYGAVQSDNKDNFEYRFSVDGNEVIYKVSNTADYVINNVLAEGYVFDLVVKDNTVIDISIPEPSVIGTVQAATSSAIKVDGKDINITKNTKIFEISPEAGSADVKTASLEVGKSVKVYGDPADVIYLTFVVEPYKPPVEGTAGQRTLKNFLATAMEPVGTALYIYGGAWDWQDVGSSNQATTIGLSQTWLDFFQLQDDTYTYRNDSNYAESYYPHGAYNEYYYAGIDCSGYVGWALYNIMNTQSGGEGYVRSANIMAKTLDQTYNYGTWTRDFDNFSFKPGDIFSLGGHVWICLGVCEDGSLVIMHSTPSDSITENPGGGVQISGVGESEDCQAYKLAQEYMDRYYPAWSEKYSAICKNYEEYTSIENSNSGKFSWNLDDTGLLDPDEYAHMSADEILKDLFGESSNSGRRPSGRRTKTYYDITVQNTDNGSVTSDRQQAVLGSTVELTVNAHDGYELDNLEVKDLRGNLIETSELKNGKCTLTMPSSNVTVTAKFEKLNETDEVAGEIEENHDIPFDDVDENDWFYNAVNYAYGADIITGVSERSFNPDGTLTRSMAVQILYNLEGKQLLSDADVDYSIKDVSKDQWFADAMYWARKEGLIAGYGNGMMGPNDPVTREQLVVLLYNYAGFKGYDLTKSGNLSVYIDSSQISDWAKDAVAWAIGSNIMNGRPGGVIAPLDSISRAEMTQIIWNFSKI